MLDLEYTEKIQMTLRILGFCLIFFFASIAPAHAYLDPGSGSLILQIVIGAVATFFFAVRNYWLKIKTFFIRKGEKPSDSDGKNRAA